MFRLNQSFKSLPLVVSLISSLSLAGCYQAAPEEDVVSGGDAKLNVITRSATSNSILYPLAIYAFGSDGSCKAQQVIEDESESISLKLSAGNYHITAVAGYGDFSLPQKPKQDAMISAYSGNYSASPLTLGQADVSLSSSSTVTIQMSLQVAGLEVSLSGLPDEVSEVSVGIANVFSEISLEGECATPQLTEIVCQQVDGLWIAGKTYLLPLSSSAMVISINVTDDKGTHTYGYTYNTPLRAGVPYILNGTFAEGLVLNGTIESNGWEDDVVLDFGFGPDVNDSGGTDDDGTQTDDEVIVTEIPEACSLWQGHVVALVGNATSTEADLLLLSLADEADVKSKASTVPDEAANFARAYSEFGLTGWRIPTKEEATALRNCYFGDNVTAINTVLEQAGGKALLQVDSKDKNVRYLCEDAAYTFSFATSSDGKSLQITKAGATVKYRLRLVKSIHVKVS